MRLFGQNPTGGYRSASYLGFIALMAAGISLNACRDDLGGESASQAIEFTRGGDMSWQEAAAVREAAAKAPGTRGTAPEFPSLPKDTVLVMEGGETPFYLHTSHTDGIQPDADEARTGESADSLLTRGARIGVGAYTMYTKIGVSAYSYTGEWNESRTPNFMYNVQAANASSGRNKELYTVNPRHYWPGGNYKMRFFAYGPKDNPNYKLSPQTKGGSPTLTVTVPSNTRNQPDVLTAATDELPGNHNEGVPLRFRHIMTAVRFMVGDIRPGTRITKVTFKDIYSKGTYDFVSNEWSNLSAPTDYEATFEFTVNERTTPEASLLAEPQTFMLIPQILRDSAAIEVTCRRDNKDFVLKAFLRKTLDPGMTVNLKISSESINWDNVFEVTFRNDKGESRLAYYGGPLSLKVNSYDRYHSGNKIRPVAWKIEYSEDDGLTYKPTSAYVQENLKPDEANERKKGGQNVDFPLTSKAQEFIFLDEIDDHVRKLRTNAINSAPGTPLDLSRGVTVGTMRIPRNTANCYVVNGYGYFCFPVVYGNAIRDNQDNWDAYLYPTTWRKRRGRLKRFIEHRGMGIEKGWLNQQLRKQGRLENYSTGAITTADPDPVVGAELLWQDAKGLISDVSYREVNYDGDNPTVGEKGYIYFKIARETIRQGNAVIAAKTQSGNVAWSWHIWVTDNQVDKFIKIANKLGEEYEITPYHLGWCDGDKIRYPARKLKVRLTNGHGKQIVYNLDHPEQNPATTFMNAPYYQWGRKDPFPASLMIPHYGNKRWYDKNGQEYRRSFFTTTYGIGERALMMRVLKPDVFDKMESNNSDGAYFANLWLMGMCFPQAKAGNGFAADAAQNQTEFIHSYQTQDLRKTVYDPCPPGMMVPTGRVFSGFTNTGGAIRGINDLNGTWDSQKGTYTLYGKPNKTGESTEFPATGYRIDNTGNGYNIGISCAIWTSAPAVQKSSINAGALYGERSTMFSPIGLYNRGWGCNIRPMKEVRGNLHRKP